MWEFSIIFNTDKKNLAIKVFNFCKKLTTKFGGVATMLVENGYEVLIGCEKISRPQIQTNLINYLIDCVLEEYKLDYLKTHLQLKTCDELKKEAYYNALLYFDFENDRDILKKNICIKNKLVIDSLFQFRLSELKTKWENICSINNQNSNYLLYNDTFYEFIKFLIDNLETTYDEINIYCKNATYYLFDKNNNEINDLLLEYPNIKNENQILSTLIKLCPRKIKIHCDTNISNDIFSMICHIFENRVEFVQNI